jgi:hypothetical protein
MEWEGPLTSAKRMMGKRRKKKVPLIIFHEDLGMIFSFSFRI